MYNSELENKLKNILKEVDEYVSSDIGINNRMLFPWEHRAKRFQSMGSVRPGLRDFCDYDSEKVYKCIYNGDVYYFGIGFPTPAVTEDMLANGEWFEYIW